MLHNAGRDHQSAAVGGDLLGATGTTTSAPTGTTVTDTGAAWTTNGFAGHVVVMGGVYGVVISNTGTVLTIDRWNNPATPGGAVGTTPGSGVYQILAGQCPGQFMGLTANATAPALSDTALAAEIVTAGGGLIRKISAYAHTAGVASYTLTTVYTANGSDSLPVTVAKMGVFQSLTGATRMPFSTLLTPSTATLSAVSDQLTVTQTVTTS